MSVQINKEKISTIKFLMTMFESSIQSGGAYRNKNSYDMIMFKNNLEQLAMRRQITPEIQRIVLRIYGIENTNIYKPNVVGDKLVQINWLMMQVDSYIANEAWSELKKFMKVMEDGVTNKTISKAAKELVYAIYDLNSLDFSTNGSLGGTRGSAPNPVVGPINTTNPPGAIHIGLGRGGTRISSSTNIPAVVQSDLNKYKSAYWDRLYYEYDNPSYDGCSGSSRLLHTPLESATKKPKGAKVVFKLNYDDGCISRDRYIDPPSHVFADPPAPTASSYVSSTSTCDRSGSGRVC